MNQYLKAASNSFNKIKEKDYPINPISEIDCEIITEIRELLKKAGLSEVAAILKEYKYLKDEDIRDQLLQANIDFTSKLAESLMDEDDRREEIEKRRLEREFIKIKNHRLLVNFIFAFKTEESYDKKDNYTGSIILNPVPSDITRLPLYANYAITTNDEEDFEDMVIDFEAQLEKTGVKFVNENNNIEEDED